MTRNATKQHNDIMIAIAPLPVNFSKKAALFNSLATSVWNDDVRTAEASKKMLKSQQWQLEESFIALHNAALWLANSADQQGSESTSQCQAGTAFCGSWKTAEAAASPKLIKK